MGLQNRNSGKTELHFLHTCREYYFALSAACSVITAKLTPFRTADPCLQDKEPASTFPGNGTFLQKPQSAAANSPHPESRRSQIISSTLDSWGNRDTGLGRRISGKVLGRPPGQLDSLSRARPCHHEGPQRRTLPCMQPPTSSDPQASNILGYECAALRRLDRELGETRDSSDYFQSPHPPKPPTKGQRKK